MKYIMSLDEGTTSCRTIIFDYKGNIVSVAQKEFTQIFPKEGWVEHNPEEIWETQLYTARSALNKANISAEDIEAIGIANQRETTIVWDKNTGKAIYNAIVWQCKRTSKLCSSLYEKSDFVKEKTGLPLDPYFSASKIRWILDNVKDARQKAEKGELLFGTIDSWLIWKLTAGKVHITDYSNAARTMLFNIHTLCWDEELCDFWNIPMKMLPKPVPSSGICAYTDKNLLGAEIPIGGIAGDQQAALFGQCCFKEGEAKNTYGTGCFLLMNTGERAVSSKNGLITTIAWNINGKTTYALEGSVFIAGAAIQWLRDQLGILENSMQSEQMALSVSDTAGVYLVPAFSGLGAPYWDPYARGILVGLTRACNKNHIVRAALEAMAYQSFDVLNAMQEDCKFSLTSLKVDGGAAANNFLLQYQADINNCEVQRPSCIETTALGAAYLAGLSVGYWKSLKEIKENWNLKNCFNAKMSAEIRKEKLLSWKKAVKCSEGWAK